jgi:hypothetical protein
MVWRRRDMATHQDIQAAVDPAYVARATSILDTLQSFFLEMPRTASFCGREDFQTGYDAVREETHDGADLSGDALLRAISREPRAWLVLRSIVGMSPGEAAYLAIEEASARNESFYVEQKDAREIDARGRKGERLLFDERAGGSKQRRFDELLRRIVPLLADVIRRPAPIVDDDKVHRLDKLDTTGGQATIQAALTTGVVPYSEMLYERMLGRPYASHRDSVSGIVGRIIESAINDLCERHGIDGRPTKSREAVPGFEQAPDYLIPAVEPRVIIEAKLTEDDGTARDKAARLQTLRQYEDARPEHERRTIIAVIDGRGFGHRLADLNRMLRACDGLVYTLDELEELVADGGPLAPYVGTRKS